MVKSLTKTLAGIALAGLTAVTLMKDNVHFSLCAPVELENPSGNHYIWGPVSISRITSSGDNDVKANIRNFGLLAYNGFEDGISFKGDLNANALIMGLNDFRYANQINGDSKAYGLIIGVNNFYKTKYEKSSEKRKGFTTSVGIITKNENGTGIGPRNILRYEANQETQQ